MFNKKLKERMDYLERELSAMRCKLDGVVKKSNKNEVAITKMCKHEKYFFNFGHIFQSKKCVVCGESQFLTFQDWEKEKAAQEVREAKELIQKYDKKVAK